VLLSGWGGLHGVLDNMRKPPVRGIGVESVGGGCLGKCFAVATPSRSPRLAAPATRLPGLRAWHSEGCNGEGSLSEGAGTKGEREAGCLCCREGGLCWPGGLAWGRGWGGGSY
jgi:hypothetical protein